MTLLNFAITPEGLWLQKSRTLKHPWEESFAKGSENFFTGEFELSVKFLRVTVNKILNVYVGMLCENARNCSKTPSNCRLLIAHATCVFFLINCFRFFSGPALWGF